MDLPGEQREQERQGVVGGVPGIEQAAQEEHEREEQEGVVPGAAPEPGRADQ
jgi:hypothetical protein